MIYFKGTKRKLLPKPDINKEKLERIKAELTGIEPEDLTKAEQNILRIIEQ